MRPFHQPPEGPSPPASGEKVVPSRRAGPDEGGSPDSWVQCAGRGSGKSVPAIVQVLLLSCAIWLGTAGAPTASGEKAGPSAFRTDVLPVLTKAGCNSGACHGAATGQGGFKLSLLGYDSDEDFARITRELGGRRVDLARPEQSLILRKPADEIDHEGGRKLPRSSAGYEVVRRWIAAGAPSGMPTLQVTAIVVEPSDTLLANTNQSRQLRVFASLSDGSREEVTGLALYTSNDEAIAEVTKGGAVTSVGRGLTSIMIRYSGQVAATRIAVPFAPKATALSDFPSANFIDEQVRAELERLRLPASELSDDAEFLRRVCLDITGRLPDTKLTRTFLSAPPSSVKREQVIRELLGSDAFVDFWTMKLADLLLLNGAGPAANLYYGWLREQVETGQPLDQVVRNLLTASGSTRRVGPANYFALSPDPRDLSEHVGRMFLGAQIACARCHAHPADRWTQEDYHRFAAYFARVTHDDGAIAVATQGEVNHPKSGRVMTPRALGATGADSPYAEPADRRRELATWLAATNNALFTRTMANRVWKHLLGRGLVEPVDDLRPTNPPSHPVLLDLLATELVAHGFDLRHLIYTIASSRTYQLTSRVHGINTLDTQLYAHAYPKPLPAAVFADAVVQVTGVADVYDGQPAGTRAVQINSPATSAPALDALGRCQRKRPCDGGATTGGGLAQALHLINGSTINTKLNGSLVTELVGRSNGDVIEEVYRRALTRPPSSDERAEWERALAQSQDRKDAVQDLLWTLLNSREFAVNH